MSYAENLRTLPDGVINILEKIENYKDIYLSLPK